MLKEDGIKNCIEMKVKSVENLYIKYAGEISGKFDIYINFVDFVRYWALGFAVNIYETYPKNIVVYEGEENKLAGLDILDLSKYENTPNEVVLHGLSPEKEQVRIYNRQFSLLVSECSNLAVRVCCNNCNTAMAILDVKYSTFEFTNNLFTKSAVTFVLNSEIDKVKNYKLKNSMLGVDISLASDGVNTYKLSEFMNDFEKDIKKEKDVLFFPIIDVEPDRSRTVDKINVSVKSDTIYSYNIINGLSRVGWAASLDTPKSLRLVDKALDNRVTLNKVDSVEMLCGLPDSCKDNIMLLKAAKRLYSGSYGTSGIKVDLDNVIYLGEDSFRNDIESWINLGDKEVYFSDNFLDLRYSKGRLMLETSNYNTFKRLVKAIGVCRRNLLYYTNTLDTNMKNIRVYIVAPVEFIENPCKYKNVLLITREVADMLYGCSHETIDDINKAYRLNEDLTEMDIYRILEAGKLKK